MLLVITCIVLYIIYLYFDNIIHINLLFLCRIFDFRLFSIFLLILFMFDYSICIFLNIHSYFIVYYNLCFYVYDFVFWNNLPSLLWSGPHALSQTHEWRKALISSVRAWLGQALTNEDAAFRQLRFLLPDFFLCIFHSLQQMAMRTCCQFLPLQRSMRILSIVAAPVRCRRFFVVHSCICECWVRISPRKQSFRTLKYFFLMVNYYKKLHCSR